MATSGTKTFQLTIADTIEEAYELAGLELRTGYDAETARRSLNIMFADWSNRGVNLWTIDQVATSLTSGTNSYTLNAYDIDIVSAIIRQVDNNTTTDLQITRIGRTEYLNIPDKDSTGRPTQYFLDRQVPSRFIPCMASGLAYYIAMKRNPEKVPLLKQQYEQDFKLAADEDRGRVSLHLVPHRSYL